MLPAWLRIRRPITSTMAFVHSNCRRILLHIQSLLCGESTQEHKHNSRWVMQQYGISKSSWRNCHQWVKSHEWMRNEGKMSGPEDARSHTVALNYLFWYCTPMNFAVPQWSITFSHCCVVKARKSISIIADEWYSSMAYQKALGEIVISEWNHMSGWETRVKWVGLRMPVRIP